MPRVARFVCSGVPFHITQRGNRRCSVFTSDCYRDWYLSCLRFYVERHGLAVLAYCLMSNHVHLVAVPASVNALERVLRPLHMRHAQRINRLEAWNGHLWQGRNFAAALDEQHLWAAIRYVELNPVTAILAAWATGLPGLTVERMKKRDQLSSSIPTRDFLAARQSSWRGWPGPQVVNFTAGHAGDRERRSVSGQEKGCVPFLASPRAPRR